MLHGHRSRAKMNILACIMIHEHVQGNEIRIRNKWHYGTVTETQFVIEHTLTTNRLVPHDTQNED
jgi:hypothetical protein